MNSPLGKYAAPAAAVASLAIIGAALVGLLFGAHIGIPDDAQNKLQLLAALAAGALFGSSVAVNGYKAPLDAVHRRLDHAGIPEASSVIDAEATVPPM